MLSFMHVHIVALRYFTETVRKKSMRQAADALNIARPLSTGRSSSWKTSCSASFSIGWRTASS